MGSQGLIIFLTSFLLIKFSSLFFVWWVQESLAWQQEDPSSDLKMRFQWSQRSHYIKSGPRRSQKYLSTPFVRPASSLSGRGRGEKYSQPVPPYFNELLGILQVGGVFWNLILIGGQRFKINLFICFVHPQKTSKQPIIGNSQSRRKGAPWKIWARPKQSRFEDFKQLITNCRKYMNGVAHRRNGSEFKLIYAVLI